MTVSSHPTSSGKATTFEVREAALEIVSRHPVVGVAVGVVRDGALDFFGHGVADTASNTPITEHTVFRIASITKTFTAIAVMQLSEQGLIDLDSPANDYLRAYQLIPARSGWRPATVRHLLSHSAGLPEVAHPSGIFRPNFGESFEAGRPLPSLAAFYGGGLGVYAEPGTRFVYNNHGPATLGQLVEDVSGVALDRYLHDHIFEPLGMADSDLLRSERIMSRLATGYEIGSRGVKAVSERDMVTAGAASIYSTPKDMARYLMALLGGGSNDHGSILKPETLAAMFQPQYQPDPRIAGMGLGFFRKDLSGHPVVRHQGTHPGFHSEIAVAPGDGVAVMAFTNGARQADFWLPVEVSGLLRRILDIPDDSDARVVPYRPGLWDGICGWYRLSARLSDVRLRGMMGFGAEVFIRDGRLMFRFLTLVPALARGFPLEPDDPDDPYAFRIDLPEEGLEPIRIVFGQGGEGTIDRLYLDLMPLTLDKQPLTTNPRRWAGGALAAMSAAFTLRMIRTATRRM
jgi:CubicO group peptidase (beta-lactamase class C family)